MYDSSLLVMFWSQLLFSSLLSYSIIFHCLLPCTAIFHLCCTHFCCHTCFCLLLPSIVCIGRLLLTPTYLLLPAPIFSLTVDLVTYWWVSGYLGWEIAQSTPFDAASGVEIHPDGSIGCDDTMRAAEDVYVAGDIARFPLWLNNGAPCRVEHWVRPGHAA